MSSDQIIPTFAFVTLLTSDSYLPGVLTTLKSLQDAEHSITNQESYETVCLVTPSTVGQNSIKALEKSFDRVIGVETITTTSWSELKLLGRNDLAESLTKLHIFRLTQYKKVIYLDADTLVLRSISHLFEVPEVFSAAPDIGWPDAFNSGVMVVTPSERTFEDLIKMMGETGSFDGGDQGLLNEYFTNWNRLSFTYNVTPSAYYTYAPAYRRHGESTSILHFIGQTKPWSRGNRSNSSTSQDALQNDYYNLLGKWYDVFERHFGMGNTIEVASRVVNPPASFKSTYSDLPNRNPRVASSTPLSLPIPIQSSSSSNLVASSSVWDPSKSSPPRNSSALQMKEAITTKYDNVWDDPSKAKQRARFQAPSQYAPPPTETQEWYSSVTKAAPNPKALRPVFPWEEKALAASTSTSTSSSPTSSINSKDSDLPASARIASRTFPEDELPRPLPTINTSSGGSLLVKPSIVSPLFTNAWDSIPGINRYAKSLAKATAAKDLASKNEGKDKKKNLSNSSNNNDGSSPGSSNGGQGIGWKSSLKEMRDYPRRGDASSRDGDDEDDEEDVTENDEEESEVEKDRVKIIFKVKPTQLNTSTTGRSPIEGRSRSGSAESTTGGGGLGNLSSINSNNTNTTINKPRKDSRNVPTSPRLGTRPLHHSHHHPGMHERRQSNTSSSSMTSAAQLASDLLDSPRLAATAIRNSAAAAARASGAGNGDNPPLIRATRVFSDSTDTSRIKEEGLIALRKFMSQEGGSGGGGASLAGGLRNNGGVNNGGGAGSGGAFMY